MLCVEFQVFFPHQSLNWQPKTYTEVFLKKMSLCSLVKISDSPDSPKSAVFIEFSLKSNSPSKRKYKPGCFHQGIYRKPYICPAEIVSEFFTLNVT